MTTSTGKRIRLELDERRARGAHAAIREALTARLLSGDHLDAARDVLELLDRKVPGWLDVGPIGGEAGYLVAADAILRALVAGEDRGRRSLPETELLRELGDAKPLGATAADVLTRMRRETFITVDRHHDESWFTAARPGRRFLHRDTAAQDDIWSVRDADALLDLIYAEHRPGGSAYRPCVQAIGRLDDDKLGALADVLIGLDLLAAPDVPVSLVTWLELTLTGIDLARERWRDSAPAGMARSLFDGPPPPPMPFRRQLPLVIRRDDRSHPDDGRYGSGWCAPAAWLQRSSRTKLFAALKRDGAVQLARCARCDHGWIVYLQGFTADDQPAYVDPAAATCNRPMWRRA